MRELNMMTDKIYATKIGIARREISEDGMSAELTLDTGQTVWFTCRSADEAEYLKFAGDVVQVKDGEWRLATYDRFYP